MKAPAIVHFMRAPAVEAFSIESIAETIRSAVPGFRFSVHRNVPSRLSPWGILIDLFRAGRVRGDVFHVTGDSGYIALALTGRRTILTIHDCSTFHRTRGVHRFMYWLLWLWLPARKARLVTVVSDSTKRDVLSITGVSPEKVRVIHNGIGRGFFAASDADRWDGRRLPVLLQVGTKANKNVERLAEAIDGLPCQLVLVGSPMESQLSALTRYGVNFVVRRNLSESELIEAYMSCDLVTFVSLSEGFGLPIIEGQACGRPVVASNIEPHREIAGQSACLVDPLDVKDIRAGIERVLADFEYRKELVERGRRNARRFTPEQMALGYAAAYREILESAHG